MQVQERGARARTRQAILAAAIEVLGQNPNAALSEIATAADVGRTTLHRYFPERSDLLRAVAAEGAARLDRATASARLDEGTGAEALLRLCREYFDLGSLLSLIFTDPECLAEATPVVDDGCDDRFSDMVDRGHRDGTIDDSLPAPWLSSLMWSQLYAGWSYVTQHGASRHDVLRLLVRTVDGAVAPRPNGSR
ncbi:TetR/AcrR family transcriptional regulator [Asanoa sp. WMMD1127]|uniref:TetR/AcrR family transcriptional regulator n=1 Tax=Asanoa sp. WMMD1127 TaxID=3016107 RepID=UPI00241602E2|nr:TetR/AcrR family transcriptional regulator [Asanoa sp. WMMD1127]MDG4827644.1 TetR/AcrR family transcriptional regulator [Asanoa sp. WMMD1127]